MNKLTALSKLAGAYHHLNSVDPLDQALDTLYYNFNYIRRSLNLDDLKPLPKDTEGFNPKGPVHF